MDGQPPPGLTLLELLCGIALMGVMLSMAAVPVSRAADILAVRAARGAILNAAATARGLAPGHGGASLTIRAADGVIAVDTRDGLVADTLARLGREQRVAVTFDDAGLQVATIRLDALGLGRLASRTVSLKRGRVRAGVTFSAYGRARPW